MSEPPPQPLWIRKEDVIARHDVLVEDYGGLKGVRDGSALESALERPRNRHFYDAEADIFDLAAEYGFGIVRNHPFADGNKRTALLLMKWFIEGNGYVITASDDSQIEMVLDVAPGRMNKDELASWLRRNSRCAGTEIPR